MVRSSFHHFIELPPIFINLVEVNAYGLTVPMAYTDIVFHAIEDKEDENLNMIQDMITHYLTMPSVSARIKQKYEWLKEHFNYGLLTCKLGMMALKFLQ